MLVLCSRIHAELSSYSTLSYLPQHLPTRLTHCESAALILGSMAVATVRGSGNIEFWRRYRRVIDNDLVPLGRALEERQRQLKSRLRFGSHADCSWARTPGYTWSCHKISESGLRKCHT